MNVSTANVPAPDDRPAHRAAPPTGIAVRAPRLARRTVSVLAIGWLGVCILLAVVCAVCLATGIGNLDFAPLHIVIGGDSAPGSVAISGIAETSKDLLAIGAVTAALLLVLLLPIVLLLILGALAVAILAVLVAVLGVPLLGLAIALAVVASPLWIVALVIWLLARHRASPARTPSATIAA